MYTEATGTGLQVDMVTGTEGCRYTWIQVHRTTGTHGYMHTLHRARRTQSCRYT